MNPPVITKKGLVLSFIFSLTIVGFVFISQINNNQTKLVFCDVGQGDAAYIRIKNKIDLLIDAGPDRKVLNCLGKYMPFYDRKIELTVLSHPQKDHFGGLAYVLDRYKVEKLLMSPLDNNTQSFKRLKQKIAEKKIRVDFPVAGTIVKFLDNDKIIFYWPPKNLINNDLNDSSLVFSFEEDSFKALFTSDVSSFVLDRLLNQKLSTITILKVPHHGSKNGLTKKFLQLANPMVSVITVGKNNSYNHPAKEVLQILKASKTKIRRTDEEGDIVFNLRK